MPKAGGKTAKKKKETSSGGSPKVKIVGSKIVRTGSVEIVEVDADDDAMSQTSNATYTVDYPVTPMIGESNREGPICFSPEPADYSQSFIDNERSVQSSTVSE
ncbi:unnamed protein product, partial [Nesidiocoris tenuis]